MKFLSKCRLGGFGSSGESEKVGEAVGLGFWVGSRLLGMFEVSLAGFGDEQSSSLLSLIYTDLCFEGSEQRRIERLGFRVPQHKPEARPYSRKP